MEIGGHKLTERAKLVLKYAHESSILTGGIVGTEHILLGLAKEINGIASGLLAVKGATVNVIENFIDKYYGSEHIAHVKTDFTPRGKNVLETSVDESRRFNDNFIGTEHILLALLRENDGLAIRILHEIGIDEKEFYAEVCRIIDNTKNIASEKVSPSIPPSLLKFGRDISGLAEENRLDPVIGRETEICRVIQILCRRTKNNPVLIGEPGVGKTAVAEGLAEKIAAGSVPPSIAKKRIFALDIASMIAGAKYRGEFEERIKKVLADVKKAGDIILFIDEMHTLIGAGAAEGAIDAANILKPVLARGEIRIIGATTINEYRRYIEKDPAFERRFQSVSVDEPSEETSIEILKGIKNKYEQHHNVIITDDAVAEAVRLSVRYIPDRFLPDKAIDLIDETAAALRLKSYSAPAETVKTENRLSFLRVQKEKAIINRSYETAAALRDEELKLKKRLGSEKQVQKISREYIPITVTANDIAERTSLITNIPANKLSRSESDKLLMLEKILHNDIIGQDEAVNAVSKAIRRSRVGLCDPCRPIGSFIFSGPTGVGKTELSSALATAVFGDKNAFIKLDMSEYSEKHSVSKMIGSPPGYIGFEQGGLLTEKVHKRPYSVIVFDEIEKAHPDIFNMLLQIMDDGTLTDSHGRKINFKNTIIIMTSNIGASRICEKKNFGFSADDEKTDYSKVKSDVLFELKKYFRPEFLNRVDETLVFKPLNKDEIKQITRLLLGKVEQRLEKCGIKCSFSDDAVNLVAAAGYDRLYGARPLKRAIQTMVEDILSTKILDGSIGKGDEVFIYEDENRIIAEKINVAVNV